VRPLVSAAIIAVGSELLTPSRTDTNSLAITAVLERYGIALRGKTIVGDVRGDLAHALRDALARVDLVVLCGGLGPTDDDVTRDVVAEVLGRDLVEDSALVERLHQRFASRGLTMPDINRRQAMVPTGAAIVPNPNGTAPGLWMEHGDQVVVLLPGPPRELTPMIETLGAARIEPRAGATRLFTGVVRVAGQTESHAEQLAHPLYDRWRAERRGIDVTTLAAPGSIDFHLTVRAASPPTAGGRWHRRSPSCARRSASTRTPRTSAAWSGSWARCCTRAATRSPAPSRAPAGCSRRG
jgi:nicotinamide-nucleotide amidase